MVNWAGVWGTLSAGLGMWVATQYRGAKLPNPWGLTIADVPASLMPKPTPLSPEGPYVPNTLLRQAVKLFEGQVHGSETVAVGGDGTLYLADQWGFVFTAAPTAGGAYRLNETPLAHLGAGRPLGMDLDPSGNLVVCVSGAGLLRVDTSSGEVTLLATAVDIPGERVTSDTEINYANDPAVAADGIVYFTDSVVGVWPAKNAAGFWDTMGGFLLALYQGSPSGRLLKYDPATRKATVVTKGFWFANGVALSRDETYVFVAESVSSRVHRVWVKGPKAGTREVLIDDLPGYPDGVGRSSKGGFWVALAAPASPLLPLMRLKIVRWFLAHSPIKPPVKNWGAVVEVSEEGRVLRFLQDPDGRHVHHTTSVAERKGRLFIGNLAGDYVSYVDVDALASAVPESSASAAGSKGGNAGAEAPGEPKGAGKSKPEL